MGNKAYSKRSDLEKVISNWKKTIGLFKRREYSLSILRAAVTAELASNYVIRQELCVNHGLPHSFVDKQLKLANGLQGKLDRLYMPILEGTDLLEKVKDIAKQLKQLNKQRNDIAHKGEFRKRETAEKFIALAENQINSLINNYEATFQLLKFIPSDLDTRSVVLPGYGNVNVPLQKEEKS